MVNFLFDVFQADFFDLRVDNGNDVIKVLFVFFLVFDYARKLSLNDFENIKCFYEYF